MSDVTLSRSLLKVGGGLLHSSHQTFKPSSSSSQRRPKSRTHSGELRREDLEWRPSNEASLRTFLRWKEFTRVRREAWEVIADDFEALKRHYERLQRENELLRKKERLGRVFDGWKTAVRWKSKDWRRGLHAPCWRIVRHWRKVTVRRAALHRIAANCAAAVAHHTAARLLARWRTRLVQFTAIRTVVRRYEVGNLVRFGFRRLKMHLDKSKDTALVRARLARKASIRCLRKSFEGWVGVHRSSRLAVQLIFRISSRGTHNMLKCCYAQWLHSLLQTRKLRSVLTSIYEEHLSESLHRLALFSLHRLTASLRYERSALPKNLQVHFLSSYEDRVRQMSQALEHDKELFQREKRGLMERQRRMQSIVSSQASRLYGELQADIDASTIRREDETETRIQPDNP